MITLDEKHPPVGIWYISLDDKSDFLGCITKPTASPQHYEIDFRFRYYKDEEVFDSKDEKSWYHLTDTKSQNDDEVVAKFRDVVLRIAETKAKITPGQQPKMTEMLYRDYPDMHAFLEAFQNQPFAYSKQVSSKEAEEKYGVPPKV